MAEGLRCALIGAGNVAWHLGPELENAGYAVHEVYSRNPRNAATLVERLYHAEVKKDLDFSSSSSQLFIICVSDDAIKDVVTEIALPEESILVHTSGAQPLSILDYAATEHIGVLYPLQTFSKQRKISFKEIPIFIESDDMPVINVLSDIAESIASRAVIIDSKSRKALHIAAVFACNFTNHMLTLSKSISESNDLDFGLLQPLIVETITKSLEIGPEFSQTGPAIRKDLQTLDNHLEFLANDEEVQKIYRIITQHIIDYYDI